MAIHKRVLKGIVRGFRKRVKKGSIKERAAIAVGRQAGVKGRRFKNPKFNRRNIKVLDVLDKARAGGNLRRVAIGSAAIGGVNSAAQSVIRKRDKQKRLKAFRALPRKQQKRIVNDRQKAERIELFER